MSPETWIDERNPDGVFLCSPGALVGDISVHRASRRQAVLRTHDKPEERALPCDTAVWPPEERKQTVKKIETTAEASKPASLEAVGSPGPLSAGRVDGWLETDVLQAFLGSFLARGVP